MAARPFESRIQDLVYNVDVGVGLRLIKAGLYMLFVVGVMLLYTATQFKGLDNAEAMEQAQLGRTFMREGRLVTRVVRPVTLWFLIEHRPDEQPMVEDHPDILHPPLYPMLQGVLFRLIAPSFEVDRVMGVFSPGQWITVPLGHAFTLGAGLLLWLLGRRLFDQRVGLLGMTLFFLSDTVWQTSLSGRSVSMALFLVLAAVYAAVAAGSNRERGLAAWRWLLPLVLCALFCALAALTRYGAVVLAPGLALYLAFALRPRGWLWAGLMVLLFLAAVAPWLVRNHRVSGSPFGLTPLTVLSETRLFEGDAFERTLAPDFPADAGDTIRAVQAKWLTNVAAIYRTESRAIGEGLLVCFFFTTFFYRFVRSHVHLLRWGLALAMLLLLAAAGFFGATTASLFVLFWPFVILYGLAFFFLLLDRLEFRRAVQRTGVVAAVVALTAAPMGLTLLPPWKTYPYPPYLNPYIGHVSRLLEPHELMCSDMPWATAWYGDRTSMLLPQSLDEFYDINDFFKRINALYFTTLTRNKPFVRTLLTGPERSWFPIQQGRMPGDFPLNQGFPLHNMDQLFITDRERLLRRG